MDDRPLTVDDDIHGQQSTVHGPIMENIARYLMIAGIALFLIGGGVYLAVKFGIPLGRLPGDIRIEGENSSFYFPITSSILVSVILTIILNIISRFLNK
jgi:hypothetical protein